MKIDNHSLGDLEKPKAETKEFLTAELAARFRGASEMAKAAVIDAATWAASVKQLLAEAVAAGGDVDKFNFARDPHVDLTLDAAYDALKNVDLALPAFLAEILSLALRQPDERKDWSTHYHNDVAASFADPSWTTRNRSKLAPVYDLIKSIQGRAYGNPLDIDRARQGTTLANQAWRTIAPRVEYWSLPELKDETVGLYLDKMSARVARVNARLDAAGFGSPKPNKFSGMTPEQIRKQNSDDVARIERETSAELKKIAGGGSVERNPKSISVEDGELRKTYY